MTDNPDQAPEHEHEWQPRGQREVRNCDPCGATQIRNLVTGQWFIYLTADPLAALQERLVTVEAERDETQLKFTRLYGMRITEEEERAVEAIRLMLAAETKAAKAEALAKRLAGACVRVIGPMLDWRECSDCGVIWKAGDDPGHKEGCSVAESWKAENNG